MRLLEVPLESDLSFHVGHRSVNPTFNLSYYRLLSSLIYNIRTIFTLSYPLLSTSRFPPLNYSHYIIRENRPSVTSATEGVGFLFLTVPTDLSD